MSGQSSPRPGYFQRPALAHTAMPNVDAHRDFYARGGYADGGQVEGQDDHGARRFTPTPAARRDRRLDATFEHDIRHAWQTAPIPPDEPPFIIDTRGPFDARDESYRFADGGQVEMDSVGEPEDPLAFAEGGLYTGGTDSDGHASSEGWAAHLQEMIQRASRPDDHDTDERLRAINDLLSPPSAPTGTESAYARGGSVDDDMLAWNSQYYAKGGSVADDMLAYDSQYYEAGGEVCPPWMKAR